MSDRIANCAKCGRQMRMGGARFTFNRKHGVGHYLDHIGFSCGSDKDFTASMLKPYPARDEDKPWFKMIARWNAAQAALLEGRAA